MTDSLALLFLHVTVDLKLQCVGLCVNVYVFVSAGHRVGRLLGLDLSIML